MQDPLSVFCRIAERVQDLEKSLHIFCQIHVLPVAGIKVPWILYSEDRIGKVRGFCGVGRIHIGVRTRHNNGARRYYMLSNLNADRLKIDLRLHISCDEESVLNRPDRMGRLETKVSSFASIISIGVPGRIRFASAQSLFTMRTSCSSWIRS